MGETASNLTETKPGGSSPSGTTLFEESFLVRRCRNGQADAFAELVRRYQDRVYNLLYRLCRQREIAEELA